MFIITINKDSRKVKINTKYTSKYNLYLYFLIQQNLLISGEKMLMPAELKGCVTWFIYFLDYLWVRYNYTNFIIVGYVTDFRKGAFLPPPSPLHVQPRKSPSWIGLKPDQSKGCYIKTLNSQENNNSYVFIHCSALN